MTEQTPHEHLLTTLDDPEHIEWPSDFDRLQAEAAFEVLAADVKAQLGEDLGVHTGTLIQDASFHGEIVFPARLLVPGDLSTGVGLRVSNFGRLASIAGEDRLLPDVAALTKQVLSKHGYRYLPEAALQRPYSGRIPAHVGIPTWWYRFFEYL